MKDINEAIEIMKEEYDIHYNIDDKLTTDGFKKIKYALKALLDFVKRVESAEMPKKKECKCTESWFCGCDCSTPAEIGIYNRALDDCKLYIAQIRGESV